MAITTKYLEDLGIDKETAAKIFAERSKEIEADKADKEKLENELKEKKESLDNLTKDFNELKANNASAEDFKKKYEDLVADNEAKAKKAEEERKQAEKDADILNRFTACVGDKKFSHDAIKASYLKKFGEALESDEYKGKGDTDIFHALTKDDATAFTGVTRVNLAGGNPPNLSSLTEKRTDTLMKAMGITN